MLLELGASVADRGALNEQELGRLNDVTGRLPVRARLERTHEGGYVVDFTPVGGSWADRVERELSGAFAAMLRRSSPPRLKRCGESRCRRFFYDDTRSRTRRWCEARTCGNRARVRRHRRRPPQRG